jgi:ligand-binding SRPBCC domain-containing protein
VHTLVFESEVGASVQQLWEFHRDVSALKKLAPPGATVTIVGDTTAVEEGAIHELVVRRGFVPIRWVARIHDVSESGFTDTAVRSPFAAWSHKHEFLAGPNGSILRDTVTFALPFGPLGKLVAKLFVIKDITRMFEHRHAVTRAELGQPRSD